MNQQYWDDLIYEGQKLTEVGEGLARDLDADISPSEDGRAQARRHAEQYRASVDKPRALEQSRPEHLLQDVIDAFRWNNPEASRAVRRGVGFDRPGR